jgi:hypothetical protein
VGEEGTERPFEEERTFLFTLISLIAFLFAPIPFPSELLVGRNLSMELCLSLSASLAARGSKGFDLGMVFAGALFSSADL